MNNIGQQFDKAVDTANEIVKELTIGQMIKFGIEMVTDILPSQQEFRNLTGNTTTSFAFGVYYKGQNVAMGFNDEHKQPLRNKLIKGEALYDFVDFDGDTRTYFTADVMTDGHYGGDTALSFLKSASPKGLFSMIFTTGTEYSAYLENVLNLNVLSDGYELCKTDFIKSFKRI